MPNGASTPSYAHRGGLTKPHLETAPREIVLLQRKASKVGEGLGKTTGWIHRTALKNRGVKMLAGVDVPPHRRRRPACDDRRARTRCWRWTT